VDDVNAGYPPQDACSINNGGCCANADCLVVGSGEVTCTCKEGFTGDGHYCTSKHGVCSIIYTCVSVVTVPS